MSKFYFSRCCLKLFFALMLPGMCIFNPGKAFAEKDSGGKTIANTEQTVSGTIKDAVTGNPLAGVSIGVKGATQLTLSDAKGAFSIAVPDNNSILIISHVGYATQEIKVGNNALLEISLQPNSTDLAQVVVVGYGTQNKKDITGAVKSLRTDAFNKGIINSPQQLLQGKVAGVNVVLPAVNPGVFWE